MSKRIEVSNEKEVCKLFLAGSSTVEVGKIFGVSYQVIRRVLMENGIKPNLHNQSKGLTESNLRVDRSVYCICLKCETKFVKNIPYYIGPEPRKSVCRNCLSSGQYGMNNEYGKLTSCPSG